MFLKYNRRFAFLGACLGVAALACALWLQESQDWYPCALCIVQRYFYLGSVLGFLGLLFLSRNASAKPGRFLFSLCLFLVGALALAGLSAAIYHVWVLSQPGQSCGVDPLQLTLNELPWVSAWPLMFEADGLCSAQYPPVLGLSLPAWSAICFLIQLMLLGLSWRSYSRFQTQNRF